MMQQQGFRSPQSSLTVDTKTAVNSPTFPTTGTLPAMLKKTTTPNDTVKRYFYDHNSSIV